MKVSVRSLLLGSIVVTAVAFLTAGLAGNHQTGLRATIGDAAWVVSMVGFLVVLVLAVVFLAQVLVRRARRSDTA